MAKICRPIAEYKEIIASSNFNFEEGTEYKPPKVTMKRFIHLFREVEDTRLSGMVEYPLHEVLLIAFLAVLANASSWYDMERFGKRYKKWLKKFLKLENGIPSHDTFRRVFGLVNPEHLQHATVNFLFTNMQSIKKSLKLKDDGMKQICIDGKEENGTGRKYDTNEKIRNLQTLHVYDASHGICLFSELIDKKTNEIPAAQAVIPLLQLKNTVVTFDALHTQKETIKLIVKGAGDYVGALKGNQSTLEGFAKESFTAATKSMIKKGAKNYYETLEKAHNQVETRRFYLAKAKQKIEGLEEWQKLRNFICYEKYTCNVVTGKENTETRYYITSLRDIELCADAVRGHWSIENQLHWHLDYSFGEDDDTTMDQNAFSNLSLINKTALSLCKLAQPLYKDGSIRGIRKMFGWSMEDTLSEILNAFDESTLRKALENAQSSKK